MICCVCNRAWDDERCHTITLTAAERELVSKAMGKPVESCTYCGPCWKLLQDRQQGAQLIAGLTRALYKEAGNPAADQAGRRIFDFLVSKPKKSVS